MWSRVQLALCIPTAYGLVSVSTASTADPNHHRTPPAPQGKVSILAHSLGSVLTYDILVHQPLDADLHEVPRSAVS